MSRVRLSGPERTRLHVYNKEYIDFVVQKDIEHRALEEWMDRELSRPWSTKDRWVACANCIPVLALFGLIIWGVL